MSDASGQTAWSYDVEGRVLTERRTIAGITKSISYTYNLNGSVRRITYPSSFVVNNTYNGGGNSATLITAGCRDNPSTPALGPALRTRPRGCKPSSSVAG